jgi:hypothetical protein
MYPTLVEVCLRPSIQSGWASHNFQLNPFNVNALASSGITSNNQTVIILTVGNNAAQSTAVDVARERGCDAAPTRRCADIGIGS